MFSVIVAMKLVVLGTTCRGTQRSYRLQPEHAYGDLLMFLEDASEVLIPFLESVQARMPFKVQICLRAGMEKLDGSETSPHFNTRMEVVLPEDDVVEVLTNAFTKVCEKVDNFQEMGSGWVVSNIEYLDMTIGKYEPPGGSCYVKLSQFLESKKALLNIQNNDNKCFLWSVLAALFPVVRTVPRGEDPSKYRINDNPKRVSNYKAYEDRLNMTGIPYPVRVKDIPKFEAQNNISVYLYSSEPGSKRCVTLILFQK